jgi:hypothetical protein
MRLILYAALANMVSFADLARKINPPLGSIMIQTPELREFLAQKA